MYWELFTTAQGNETVVWDFLLLAVLYLPFFLHWKKKGANVLLFRSLLYLYLALVLYFTLMPILSAIPGIPERPYIPMNLEPFRDYKLGFRYAKQELLYNVIMMVPFGVLLPQNAKTRFFGTVFSTFLLSLSIELLQPLLHLSRTSDVTDLITNTVGGLLGYLLFLLLRRPLTALDRRLAPKHKTA